MHYVGAPQITVVNPAQRAESARNPLYQIRTSDTGLPSEAARSDPKTYTPGELVTLHLRVTKAFTESRRAYDGIGGMFACWPGLGKVGEGYTQMCTFSSECCKAGVDTGEFLYEPKEIGKCYARRANCMKPHPWAPQPIGAEIPAWEQSKYMGLVMYAVDESGQKIGEWDIIPETPPNWWTPPDAGCGGKSLMHANVRLKRYHEVFHWRAPKTPRGLGKKVTFRVLIKHGYTNGGAFFWPLAPAMLGGMQSNHDLALTEGEPRGSKPGWFVSKVGGVSCATVCAANGNRDCDESVLQNAASDPFALEAAIRSTFACKLPILSSCNDGAPAVASSGAGTCWYNDALSGRCPKTTARAKCSSSASATMRRICPCNARMRRRLDGDAATPAHQSSFGEPSAANAAAPRSATSSWVLAFTSMVLALRGSEPSRTVFTLALFGAVAELIPTAKAHNWLQKPESRSVGCRPKEGAMPQVQLNPGESFPMEWRIAHGSKKKFTYFVIVRAEDENRIGMTDRWIMKDYLDRAPSTAAMATMNITCGNYRANSCSDCKAGRCAGECTLANGVCELDPTNAYRNANMAYPEGRYMDTDMYARRFVSAESEPSVGNSPMCFKNNRGKGAVALQHGVEIPQGDPRNIRRPAPYNCRGSGSNLQTERKFSVKSRKRANQLIVGKAYRERNFGHTCRECGTIKQHAYYHYHMKDDERAGYNSSKYPWIVSVSKYNVWATVRHHVAICAARLKRAD